MRPLIIERFDILFPVTVIPFFNFCASLLIRVIHVLTVQSTVTVPVPEAICAVVQWLMRTLIIERFEIRFPGTVIPFLIFCSQVALSSNTCSRCAVYCYSAGAGTNVVLPTS